MGTHTSTSDQDGNNRIAIRDFAYDGTEESPAKRRKIQQIEEIAERLGNQEKEITERNQRIQEAIDSGRLDDMAALEQFEGFMIRDAKNWDKFTKEKVGHTIVIAWVIY